MELTKTKEFRLLVITVVILSVISITSWVGVIYIKTTIDKNKTKQIEELTYNLNLREQQIVLHQKIITNYKTMVSNYDMMIYALKMVNMKQLQVIKAHGLEDELEEI